MADYKNLKKNEILFNQGDDPDNMYIVKSGQIAVIQVDGSYETQLNLMGPGFLIGEMSLFDDKGRSAMARATCDSSVVVLPYIQLEKHLETLPDWVRITMRTLSEKLRTTNKKFFG